MKKLSGKEGDFMEKEKYVAPETEIVEFETVDMSLDVVSGSPVTADPFLS